MIDSHQHFWDISRNDCMWPDPSLSEIYCSFGIEDFQQAAKGLGINGSVLVQTQPCDSDSDYLLALAKRECFVKAVVAWVDLKAENVENRLDILVANVKFRGIRPMLQAIDDKAWILQDKLKCGLLALVARNLCFDALIQPCHLPVIYELARRYPTLKIVLNHAAKPNVGAGEINSWAQDITHLSACPNVYCKISGLLTEANSQHWQDETIFEPYVKHVLQCFGFKRLMWGSDWPVVNLASSYCAWFEMSRAILVKILSENIKPCDVDVALSAIFNENARQFYSI